MKLIFTECATCAAKPGTPPLCAGCLNNRDVISKLVLQCASYKELLNARYGKLGEAVGESLDRAITDELDNPPASIMKE